MLLETIIRFSNEEYSAANSLAHNQLTAFLGAEANDMVLLDFPHDFKWLNKENKIATCMAYWCADNYADMQLTTLIFFQNDYGIPQTVYGEATEESWFSRFYPRQYAIYKKSIAAQ